MRTEDVAVITITLARTTAEQRALTSALAQLVKCGLRVIAADGGSATAFTRGVQALGIRVVTPHKKGLVPQVTAAIRAALKLWPTKHLLYTEPDKYPFFANGLLNVVAGARTRDGVVIAARNPLSFATFPKGQQWTEAFMNRAAAIALKQANASRPSDYCYGPLLLSPEAALLALHSPVELGWGWRFYTMVRAHKEGLRVRPITLNLPCPREQRSEDSPAARLYRLRQLRQNLAALELALDC